jgi:hypothetical protein
MAHSAYEARALLFNRKLRLLPVPFEIPDLPELNGELGVLELKATELKNAEALSKGPDGETDDLVMMAAIIVKALVMLDSKEQVCQDNDLTSVTEWGLTVLKSLADLAGEASGIGVDLLAQTKKNLSQAPTSGSPNSSTANSEPVDPVSP